MKKEIILKALILAFILSLIAIQADTLDYPHSGINNINCESCHYVYGTEPTLMLPWLEYGVDIDDTQYNSLCWSCHNDIIAPDMETHSSLQIDNDYGNWTVECRVCHNPHAQRQFKTYGSESYLYSGISTDIQIDQPAAGKSELTKTGAGWTINEYQGLVVIPNINEDGYGYKIESNTDSILTIEGQIDLSRVTPGVDTFAIIYGKLIYDIVRLDRIIDPLTPKTGDKEVKFLNSTGTNSFADGDTTYDGICEVCHTETTHFRNDGTGTDQLHSNAGGASGVNCTSACHTHISGFAHGGGAGGGTGCEACHGHDNGWNGGMYYGSTVSHSTHTDNDSDDLRGPAPLAGVNCDTCHDTGRFPYFKSGTDSNGDGKYNLSEADVCDSCHSPGGSYNGLNSTGESVGAKDNWHTGVYNGAGLQAGKEKWCAGCHDESPSIIQSISAPNVIGDENAATRYGTGYGFYKTGHGLSSSETYPATGYRGAGAGCLDCHNSGMQHIDGIARTYQPDSDYLTYDPVSSNHQDGYRLMDVDTGYNGKYPMHIPRTGNVYFDGYGPGVSGVREDWEFALCFKCHDRDALLGPIGDPGTKTNFMDRRTAVEGFESGDFSNYPWSMGGDDVWAVQSTTYHWGTYSAKAPLLGDSQMSYLEVTLDIIDNGNISFWYKVSSELTDDYLRFKIDGIEQGNWSGEIDWTEASFAVTTGSHTFRWEYTKGSAGSSGSDIAWIDDITFPNDLSGSRWNSHDLHTDGRNGPLGPETPQYDSDFDGTADSRISCPACHNVHGSPSPVMFRHGELVSDTSPVADIVPFFDLRYIGESCVTAADPVLSDSTGGAGTRFYSPGPGDATRNGVCAMCHNEYWFNGEDDGTEFTGYARTPVIAPEISSVTGQSGSDTLAVIFSEGVFSDINSAGNLTPADFAISNGTINSVTHTAGDAVATLILSSSPNIGADTLSAATTVSIFDATNSPVDTAPVTILEDTDSPAISIQNPANGSTGIAINSNLTLTLVDSGSGVDWTTFSIQLSGDGGYSKTYTDLDTSVVSKTGTPGRYAVTVNPDTDFGASEVITVTVNVDDLSGNSTTPPSWSFTTGGQGRIVLHPSGVSYNAVFEITPTDGAWAEVLDCNDEDISYVSKCCQWSEAPGENHVFTVDMDDPVPAELQGRPIEAITIGVYARYSNGDGSINIGYSAGAAGGWKGETAMTESGDYSLITMTDNFGAGTVFSSDIENLNISVRRVNAISGELKVTEVYSEVAFGEIDTTAPALSNQNPVNGATGIVVNSNLSLTVSDTESGIDWLTFSIQLSGDKGYSQTYTDLDTSEVSKTGTPGSYDVVVNPDIDFGSGEVITVTVNVDNQAGISLTSPAWSFTTEAAGGPLTIVLHPASLVSQENCTTTGGGWDTILDSNDGDATKAVCNANLSGTTMGAEGWVATSYYSGLFTVAMDSAGLGGATINRVSLYAVLDLFADEPSINLALFELCFSGTATCALTNDTGGYTTISIDHPNPASLNLDSLTIDGTVSLQDYYYGFAAGHVTEIGVEIEYVP